MTESLTWADAELLNIDYLRTELVAYATAHAGSVAAGVRVMNKPPAGEQVPTPLVTCRRVGGTAAQMFDHPRIQVRAWHASEQQAEGLMNLVRDLLRLMPGEHGGFHVTRVAEFIGPTAVPDPDSQTPQRMMTVEETIKATRR